MKMGLLFLFIMVHLHASTTGFKLQDVNVECPTSGPCETRKSRLKNLVGEYRSAVHLKDTLRIMASDGGYESFTYALFEENGIFSLNINFKLKPIIQEINLGFTDRNLQIDPLQLISLKEGESFESEKLRENIESLQKRLEGLGFPHNAHTFKIVEVENNKVNINIAVTLGPPRIFKSIKTDTSSGHVEQFLTNKFNNLYNKPFDFNRFKLYLDDAQRELFTYGYYLISMDFTPIVKDDRVILNIKVSNDKLFTFDFKDIERETRDSLLSLLTDLFKKYKRPLNDTSVKSALQEHYRSLGFLNTKVRVEISTFRNKYKESVQLYRIYIDEDTKTRLSSVIFSGNHHYSNEKLLEMFKKQAFELASIGYYDEEYFNFFAEYLRNRYMKNGYVQVKVQGPHRNFDPLKKNASIEYVISEGRRAMVRKIHFLGVPTDSEDKISSSLQNKEGRPFNPIALVEDIKKVPKILQEGGHYFAEVTNASDDELVSYSRSGAEVDIFFKVSSGPVIKLNRILYLGNDKTRKKVISKKIPLEEGDLITPTITRDIENAISATGLFNSVSVMPVRHSSSSALTDLVVKLNEREYGLVELAPGYRTDLGLKLSGTVSYLNIGGMNRSVTLKGQVNQRLNYQTFDTRRRKEKKQLLEYNTSVNFNQSDILDTLIDYGAGISYQRKRFYSFDADIYRFNNTLTRDLTKRLSSSVRYQYETITQWDATEERDNGSFKIGSITPSLTYDIRNSQINATKGAFFNLSCEFANPYFLSQKTSDLTVNYYKLVSRNRFYIPFKNGTVALSMVGGVQENLAKDLVRDSNGDPIIEDGVKRTEGYIPNIKVFRLSGMDIVRGFSDAEINRLPNDEDISGVRIQNKAYMANLKLEPRYYLTDNLMAGVFYDAGRVFVDEVNMGELRDSVGITFKILTPVGTLDFDYGIKLERQRMGEEDNFKLEDPGRFHVSIGFF